MWRQVIASKHGPDPMDWESRKVDIPYGCGVWKGVMAGMRSFRKHITFKDNNEVRV